MAEDIRSGQKISFRNVYWLGGASSAGKTTISKLLAEEFGMLRYDGDDRFWNEHFPTATLDRSPRIAGFREESKTKKPSWWMAMSPEELLAGLWEMFPEDLSLVEQDLRSMDTNQRIVVDLFQGYPIPELVRLTDRSRIMFMVPTPEFHRMDYEKWFKVNNRRERLAEDFPNPDQMMANYVEGHVRIAERVRTVCREEGLPLLITGGKLTIEEAYASVCSHFGLRTA